MISLWWPPIRSRVQENGARSHLWKLCHTQVVVVFSHLEELCTFNGQFRKHLFHSWKWWQSFSLRKMAFEGNERQMSDPLLFVSMILHEWCCMICEWQCGASQETWLPVCFVPSLQIWPCNQWSQQCVRMLSAVAYRCSLMDNDAFRRIAREKEKVKKQQCSASKSQETKYRVCFNWMGFMSLHTSML